MVNEKDDRRIFADDICGEIREREMKKVCQRQCRRLKQQQRLEVGNKSVDVGGNAM